jgi:hypothetical protein
MGFFDKLKGAADQASKAGSMNTGMGVGDVAAYQQKAVRLNQAGVNTPATVRSMAETGNTDIGGSTEIRFEVEVRPADGDPYTATFSQFMVAGSTSSLAEGSEVTVRVDPDDPNSMIFWGAGSP